MYEKTQPILIFDQISFGELCFRGYPFTPWSPMLWSFRLWPWQLSKHDIFDIPSENITFYFLKISDNSMLNQYLYFVYHSHFFGISAITSKKRDVFIRFGFWENWYPSWPSQIFFQRILSILYLKLYHKNEFRYPQNVNGSLSQI